MESPEGSPIERQLLAESLPKHKRRWLVGLGICLALAPFAWMVWRFGAALKSTFFSPRHQVELSAFGSCESARVHVQVAGEQSAGWQTQNLPFAESRTLGTSDTARISITSELSCGGGCRVAVDGRERAKCSGTYATCDYPIDPSVYRGAGCAVSGESE